jgi:hypothetical protein
MNPTSSTPVPDRRHCRRRLSRRPMVSTCLRGTLGLGRDIGRRLHDFSEEGVRLVVAVALAAGEDVEICMAPAYQSKAVTAVGIVVWSRPTDGGYWAGVRLSRRLTYPEVCVLG